MLHVVSEGSCFAIPLLLDKEFAEMGTGTIDVA